MSPVRPSFTVVSLTGPSIFLAHEVSDTQPNRVFLVSWSCFRINGSRVVGRERGTLFCWFRFDSSRPNSCYWNISASLSVWLVYDINTILLDMSVHPTCPPYALPPV